MAGFVLTLAVPGEAALLPAGSDGVVAPDTWQGSRTPFRDPLRRGAFAGLGLTHRRAHLYRAVLESVAYGGRQVTEALPGVGTDVRQLVVTGGGSRSRLRMQIHAGVIRRPLCGSSRNPTSVMQTTSDIDSRGGARRLSGERSS